MHREYLYIWLQEPPGFVHCVGRENGGQDVPDMCLFHLEAYSPCIQVEPHPEQTDV